MNALRKIIVILTIVLAPALASAAVNFDVLGAYTMAGDLENEFGYGGAISIDINQNFNFFIRDIYNSVKKNANKPDEEVYYYNMAIAGVQYLYQIGSSQAYWTNAVAAGIASGSSEISVNYVQTKADENGLVIAYWTGILVHGTQHISPFIEIGYHKAFYNSQLDGANVAGFQFCAGVRFSFFGKNRSLDADY